MGYFIAVIIGEDFASFFVYIERVIRGLFCTIFSCIINMPAGPFTFQQSFHYINIISIELFTIRLSSF